MKYLTYINIIQKVMHCLVAVAFLGHPVLTKREVLKTVYARTAQK